MVECLLSVSEVASSILVKVCFLFAGPHLLQLQHLLAAVHRAAVADAGLIITFFSCGQSMFMQCYSVALNKCLISATVHAGYTPEYTMHTCIHIHAVMSLDSAQMCIFPDQTCRFSSCELAVSLQNISNLRVM